jgi:hypothetical protein
MRGIVIPSCSSTRRLFWTLVLLSVTVAATTVIGSMSYIFPNHDQSYTTTTPKTKYADGVVVDHGAVDGPGDTAGGGHNRMGRNDSMLVAMHIVQMESLPSSLPRTTSNAKPHLYLHIGPHKTGTTTIQDILARYATTLSDHDNIVFLGKVNREMADQGYYSLGNDKVRPLVQWMTEKNKRKGKKFMDGFQSALEECVRNHQHVIVSNEAFSDVVNGQYHTMISTLIAKLHQIADPIFDVHVILVYRRYYEWLVSKFKYRTTPNRNQRFRKWPTPQHQSSTRPLQDEDKNGIDIYNNSSSSNNNNLPYYREFQTIREFIHMERNQSSHPYERCIELYSAPSRDTGIVWPIHIINMHKLQSSSSASLLPDASEASTMQQQQEPIMN